MPILLIGVSLGRETGLGEVSRKLPLTGDSLKFSNPAGPAGVRKLLARNKFRTSQHKTFDALNFLCV